MLKTLTTVFYFEILLLWRRSQEWLYPIAFFVIVISLFPFAFSPDPALLKMLIPGGVWIAALFASLLSIETIFHADLEEGSLEQWMLSSVPLAFLTLAKLAAHWITTALPLIILTPFIGWMFQLPAHATMILTASLLLGTPILTLLGSFGVALTLGLRQQGVMMSLLILPLSAPVLIFGVNMVLQAEAGFSAAGPLALMAGLLVIALIGIPFAAAAALRVGLDD
jgi:heme exporter protein B